MPWTAVTGSNKCTPPTIKFQPLRTGLVRNITFQGTIPAKNEVLHLAVPNWLDVVLNRRTKERLRSPDLPLNGHQRLTGPKPSFVLWMVTEVVALSGGNHDACSICTIKYRMAG